MSCAELESQNLIDRINGQIGGKGGKGPGRPRSYLLGLPRIRACPIKAHGSSGQRFTTHGDTRDGGYGNGNRRRNSLNRAHGQRPRRRRRDSHFCHTRSTW
jgi:hypothetical protein